jgi:hypothetical protein
LAHEEKRYGDEQCENDDPDRSERGRRSMRAW